jgi:hypothetical protein
MDTTVWSHGRSEDKANDTVKGLGTIRRIVQDRSDDSKCNWLRELTHGEGHQRVQSPCTILLVGTLGSALQMVRLSFAFA